LNAKDLKKYYSISFSAEVLSTPLIKLGNLCATPRLKTLVLYLTSTGIAISAFLSFYM